MKYKIVFHLPHLTLGGVEVNSMKLANEFIKMGHEVTFLVHSLKGEHLEELNPEIKIIDANIFNIMTGRKKLGKILKKKKFDLIISSRDLYNAQLIKMKRKYNISSHLMVTCHTNAVVENKMFKNKVRKLKTWLYMKMAKKTYKYADSCVAVSQGVKKSVIQYSNLESSDIEVIYNPIIDKDFERKMNEKVLNMDLENYRYIIGAGRLVEAKNFSLLINAFNEVQKDYNNVILWIFGEGDQRKQLEDQIKKLNLEDKVILKGFESNIIKYMKKSEVFVFSSLWEGFGNALAEALATGTKVVATDCPSGPSEILKRGSHGILVKNNDLKDLIKGIKSSLNNDFETSNTEYKNNHLERFATKNVARQYIELYERSIWKK